MNLSFKQANPDQIQKVFDLLKLASKTLDQKNIKQWDYWQNPPIEKIKWVEEGFSNKEFYFIENDAEELLGMVRIMKKDLNYWGEMNDKSKYIHSFVIAERFSGKNLGKKAIEMIEQDAKENSFDYLRLDCNTTNLKLCAYYENQGFQQVGEKQLPLGVYNLYQKSLS